MRIRMRPTSSRARSTTGRAASRGCRASSRPTAPELEVPLPILPLLPNGAVPNTATPVLNGAVAVSDDEALIYFGSGVFFNVDDIGLARIAFDGVPSKPMIAGLSAVVSVDISSAD